MARSLLALVLLVAALISGCIDVPRPGRPLTKSGDAAVLAELSADASLLRPRTAEGLGSAAATAANVPPARTDAAAGHDKDGGTRAAGAAGRAAVVSAPGSAGNVAQPVKTTMDAGGPPPAGRGGVAGLSGAAGSAAPGLPPSGARRPHGFGEIVITEIMSNPAAVGDNDGEWLELYNPSAGEDLDLNGCAIDDQATADSMTMPANARRIAVPFVIAAGAYAITVRGTDAGVAGDLALSILLSNTADGVALWCDGIEIDRVIYGSGYPLASGASMALDPAALDAASNDAPSAWCLGLSEYGPGPVYDHGTPRAANLSCNAHEMDAGGRD